MKRVPESTWRELRTAFAAGIPLRELARNMGIPEGTVLARSARERWTRQIEDAKTLARAASPPRGCSAAEAVAATMAQRGERHLARMAGIAEKVVPHVEAMEPDAILSRIDEVDKLDRIARRTYGLGEDSSTGINLHVLSQINIAGL